MFTSHRLAAMAAFSFFLFIVWIIVISDAGRSNVLIDSVRAIPYGDKLGHMVLYGVLASLVSFALAPRDKTYLGLPLGCALVLLCSIGRVIARIFPIYQNSGRG